ncbi:hypothetical protein HFN63_08865 [Rhizobium leguminosarum]|nr:hypothetical protein [Rhizobium leguminosarum]
MVIQVAPSSPSDLCLEELAWWLFAAPSFIASDLTEGLARAGMLAIVSLIYLLRARAEERMLSRDPAYRDYAERVAAHGLLATAKRRLTSRPAA